MTGLALLGSVAKAFTLHEYAAKVEESRPKVTCVGKHKWDTFQCNDFNKFECDSY